MMEQNKDMKEISHYLYKEFAITHNVPNKLFYITYE